MVAVDENQTADVEHDRPSPRGVNYAITDIHYVPNHIAKIFDHSATDLSVRPRIYTHPHIHRHVPDRRNPHQCRKALTGGFVVEAEVRRGGHSAASGGAGSTLPDRARGRLSLCGPRTRHIDARCGGRKRSTIRGWVYSRVVFQVLVLQTLVSTQSGAVLLLDMP